MFVVIVLWSLILNWSVEVSLLLHTQLSKPTGQDYLTGYEVVHSQAYYAWPHWGRSKETNEQNTAITKEYMKMKNTTFHTSLKSNAWSKRDVPNSILCTRMLRDHVLKFNPSSSEISLDSSCMIKICKCFTVTIACRDTLYDWRHY